MSTSTAVDSAWEMTAPLPADLRRAGWDPLLDAVRAEATRGVDSPLADAATAAALAGAAGLRIAPRTVAAHGRLELHRDASGWRLDAELQRVPWGRDAQQVVVVAGGLVLRLPVAAATVRPGANLAGEPRDGLTFAGHALAPGDVSEAAPLPADAVTMLGALVRATAIAGALTTVLDLVTRHAAQREQFGRPLDRFQAVQEHLVTVASETAAAGMAGEIGRRGLDGDLAFAVAVAKTRAAAAATAACRAAHQVLGAVGTTELHALGRYTRRLWSWRDEHGTQTSWQRKVGERVAAAGGAGTWELLTKGPGPTQGPGITAGAV